MARIYPLFSSSKGNSTFIGSKNGGILIDDGVSFSRLKNAMELNGLTVDAIKAVFITHEHSDHTKGLAVLTKKVKAPVFAQSLTLDYLCGSGMINGEYEEIKNGAEVCGMTVECFNTPHDTRESCGYKITFSDGKTAAVCTDLGHVTDEVENMLLGTDCVLLEANYDVEMLRNGIYPYYLKTRIFSKNGHLSNPDSGEFAARLVKSGTTRIILGHLSQENNTPEIADQTVSSCLSEFVRNKDYILSVAPVETRGGFCAI
ncbi:MAG: MBL fold metallo-hydrolase [Oscillospiraceae bacterium]|nr:MBL fold metallo-hydrolase [Oscillospiraceae bacterium]